jgi:hypothetical protein
MAAVLAPVALARNTPLRPLAEAQDVRSVRTPAA